jgi:predicted permease
VNRLGWLFRRHRHEGELAEEIRAHLDEKVEELVARGMSREEAMQFARRSFGNVSRVEEESREVWRPRLLESTIADVRHALRLVHRHPAFSTNVIAISMLGVATCAATFSLVSGVLFAPLPFPNADRVHELLLRSNDRGDHTAALPIEVWDRVQAGSPVIEDIAASEPFSVTIHWNGEPERLRTRRVTPSFHRVFGVAPVLGRGFTADEADGTSSVLLLGNRLWRSRFNGDSSIVGQSIQVDNVAHTVIGIMPPVFRAQYGDEPDLWFPMAVGKGRGRPDETVNATVLLADGVSQQRAEAWLSTAAPTWMPFRRAADSARATPVLLPIAEAIHGDVERPLHVLLGAVILVLALVAANVATLFVSHTQARQRELGVRRALGASVGRQVRQLITESLTLTAIGGMLGMLASFWIVSGVRTLGVRVLPRMDTVTLDWRVLLFAVAATMVTGLLGGLAPAFTSRRDTSLLPAGGRVTGRRTPALLVVIQVTLTVVLLVGAGLLVKGFLRVLPDEPGFALENRATLLVSLADLPAYPEDDPGRTHRFISDVSEQLGAVPGVRAVAATSFVPFYGSRSTADVRLPGGDPSAAPLRAYQNLVTPNFFDVMEVPIRRGRPFTASDRSGAAGVAIVNETTAARWWPGEDPIGKQVLLDDSREVGTVVGVSADGRSFGGDTRIRPEIYFPVSQASSNYVTFVVHTERSPAALARQLHRAVWAVAPRLPIGNSSDLATIALESVRRPRFFAWTMGLFSVAAVFLSGLAVYGVLTLDVVQRRREIGIRLAMGARPGSVGLAIVKRAVTLGAIGVVAGLWLGRLGSRFLEEVLLEVTATDLTVYAGAAVVVLLLSAIAACAPAWRAIRVDPVRSLRADT